MFAGEACYLHGRESLHPKNGFGDSLTKSRFVGGQITQQRLDQPLRNERA